MPPATTPMRQGWRRTGNFCTNIIAPAVTSGGGPGIANLLGGSAGPIPKKRWVPISVTAAHVENRYTSRSVKPDLEDILRDMKDGKPLDDTLRDMNYGTTVLGFENLILAARICDVSEPTEIQIIR